MRWTIRKEFRLAVHPCRKVVGEQANGKAVHCFAVHREIKTDGKMRYGTIRCVNGHSSTGRYATLVHPMPKGVL
jgi:hypothetical protein